MTTLAARPVVTLDAVRHGLVDAAGTCGDLDAMLEQARVAERDGAHSVVVPPDDRYWPATAHALAVLLATSSVRVVVPVDSDHAAADLTALVRFAASATRLGGDRLVVSVHGGRAGTTAAVLRRRWSGTVLVAD